MKQIDIRTKIIKKYLKLKSDKDIYWFLYHGCFKNNDYQNLNLTWKNTGALFYKTYVSENKDFSNSHVVFVLENKLNEGITVPGKTYYFKVEDNNGNVIHKEQFKIKDNIVRFVDIDSVHNVRDLGGYKAGKGKVKYGMLYRGASLDSGNARSMQTFKDLGIKSEIDLTIESFNRGKNCSWEGVKILVAPITQACYMIPSFYQETPIARCYDTNTEPSIKKIFKFLANKDNYPIYFHCAAGADRTGTLAFLLNGLLGVSYEDLCRDFELTTFSRSGYRARSYFDEKTEKFTLDAQDDNQSNYVAFSKFKDMIMEEYGKKNKSLSFAIENYLLSLNVKQEEINAFKKIMIE